MLNDLIYAQIYGNLFGWFRNKKKRVESLERTADTGCVLNFVIRHKKRNGICALFPF
jgi:hypothetical protein